MSVDAKRRSLGDAKAAKDDEFYEMLCVSHNRSKDNR